MSNDARLSGSAAPDGDERTLRGARKGARRGPRSRSRVSERLDQVRAAREAQLAPARERERRVNSALESYVRAETALTAEEEAAERKLAELAERAARIRADAEERCAELRSQLAEAAAAIRDSGVSVAQTGELIGKGERAVRALTDEASDARAQATAADDAGRTPPHGAVATVPGAPVDDGVEGDHGTQSSLSEVPGPSPDDAGSEDAVQAAAPGRGGGEVAAGRHLGAGRTSGSPSSAREASQTADGTESARAPEGPDVHGAGLPGRRDEAAHGPQRRKDALNPQASGKLDGEQQQVTSRATVTSPTSGAGNRSPGRHGGRA